jgi:catechol 2,3-dioxygenase-like lactoylglutathione lyase family enzyme
VLSYLEENGMACHLHHVHIFASDIDESVKFYRDLFNGKIVLDAELAGARNVFMKIGNGRLHLYDQSPKNPGRGSIHHFGIQTDDIYKIVNNMKSKGISFKRDVADFGFWKYIMVPAPDDILIELFQINKDKIPQELLDYFD